VDHLYGSHCHNPDERFFHSNSFYCSDVDCNGGICDLSNCECDCGTGCLRSLQGNGEVGCFFEDDCICGKACSSYNTNDPDSTDYAQSGATCDPTKCDPCTRAGDTFTACPTDTDCIVVGNSDDGVCVDSGLCTQDKEQLCDEAYAVVTGKSDNSAKCCPATSGCIKSQIGVKATSTCSTNCGDCLEKKRVDSKEIPATFCNFGQRLGKLGQDDALVFVC